MKDPLHILLVSNSSVLSRSLTAILLKNKNTKLDIAADSGSAIDKIQHIPFTILLCDTDLPEKECADLWRVLKKKKIELPVLALLGPEKQKLEKDFLAKGAQGCILKKPSEFEKLPKEIELALERFNLSLREKELETQIAKQKTALRNINQKLEDYAFHDDLTGVYNHRYFQEKLREEFSRAKRYGQPLSLLMVDIDAFRTINETKGHLIGDSILKELGRVLSDRSRDADLVARYGGEEFALLLPHIGTEGALVLAERLRKSVESHVFLKGKDSLKITVSIGLSSFPDDALQKHDDLIKLAEKALIHCKGSKKSNAVCTYNSLMKNIEAQTKYLKFSEEKVIEFRQRLLDISETAKRMHIESTKTLIYALEAKDKYTLGHASRVAQYSAMVAAEMGLADEDVATIEHAGLLHDVGKVCISDEVLLKPGAFTAEEYEQMREHPVLGYQMVKPIKFLKEEALIILHHHEWFDGTGYPHGLKGKEIPVGARIVAVLDAYDTMRAAGARYKKTMSMQQIVQELVRQSSTQFDPEVVTALLRVLVRRGEVKEDSYDAKKLRSQ
ncbi:MAG: hypothetical protein COV74_10765 [Candidatus Omnitrophica bacterium CG11_big_fil_rev_8_21_14_0_20_45_26]|uniref:Diguanylate cyclase n=1 Tax=Candidatus Abzuiibacterium crystallinum TaxID=1974748 RepID=A0A2H0LKX5_9BACT|nr:MAG: hypothetical protein COV74_10765 [Candidatus Omnitrophica bacterium CG11_big_fil_rev_8_21_14_0_20_45_26]PIW63853.1 MAG: hypothetical protein COW12_08045 [Candidatus Omnitrophica bacterium CG12_big_fil_rev_8_21_14_0_65_45_16]